MEHVMSKTIQLTGKAFELAVLIDKIMSDERSQINALREQANAISKASMDRSRELHKELKKLLGLDDDAHCHLDLSYVEEHNLAFVKTGCEPKNELPDIISKMMAGMSSDPSDRGVH